MGIRDHSLKRALDPRAVRIGYDERRQKLDGVASVPRDLNENPVLAQQWNHDQLAKQSAAGSLQQIPGRLEPQRPGRAELDPDHQPFAPYRLDQLITLRDRLERSQQARAHARGVLNEMLGFND